MRVGIAGDGPAGHLASWLFKRAGWDVEHWMAPNRSAFQAAHVHLIDVRLPKLSEQLGLDLGSSEPDWRYCEIKEDGSRQVWTAPHLRRAQIVRALEKASAATACGPIPDGSLADYDLLVDATGGSRALLNRLVSDVSVSDCGGMERYQTYEGALKGQRSLTRWREATPAYLEVSSTMWRLTTFGNAVSDPPTANDINTMLDAGGVKPPLNLPKPMTMLGPVARQVAPLIASGRAILPFGDALIQTSPSLGFGMTSVFQQGCLLFNLLNSGADTRDILEQFDVYADTLWAEASMSALAA